MACGGSSQPTELDQLDDLKEEFLMCKVCTMQYTMEAERPKQLPCGHTYCMSCIDKLDNHHCPVCRTPFRLTNAGAKSLPDNLTIKKLFDYFKIPKRLPAAVSDTTCEECSRELKSVSWCYHCRRQICEKCAESHTQMRSFSGHIVVPLNDIDLTDAQNIFYCENHKNEKLEKFCKVCQHVICAKCAMKLHPPSSCNVVELKEVEENNYSELNTLVDEVLSTQRYAVLKSCLARRKSEMLDKSYQTCIDDIEEHSKRIRLTLEKTISDQERRLKTTAKYFMLASIDQYKKEAEEAELFLSQIGSTLDTFQPILNRKCPVEISQTLTDHRETFNELITQSKLLPGSTTDPNIAYSFLSFTHKFDDLPASIINNSAVNAFNIAPANTVVSVEEGIVGVPCSLKIKLHNRKKEPCSCVPSDIKIDLLVYISDKPFNCQFQMVKPGEFETSFLPVSRGYCRIALKVMREPVSVEPVPIGELSLNLLNNVHNIVRVNVTNINADGENSEFDLNTVGVNCIDPLKQTVNSVQNHSAKGILEVKFVLKRLGKHFFHILCRDIIVKSEELCVNQQQIGQRKKDIGFQNIVDIAALQSGLILVLDMQVKGKMYRLSTWNGEKCTGTTFTSIETQYKSSLAVGKQIEVNGCICYADSTRRITSLAFFAHTPTLTLMEEEIKLEEGIEPLEACINSKGQIIICTSDSNIQIFLPNGCLHKSIIKSDNSSGIQIKKPVDLCLDLEDNLFIYDSEMQSIHMLNSDFSLARVINSPNLLVSIAVNEKHLFTLEKQRISMIIFGDELNSTKETIELSSRVGIGDKLICTRENFLIVKNKSRLIKCMYSGTQDTN